MFFYKVLLSQKRDYDQDLLLTNHTLAPFLEGCLQRLLEIQKWIILPLYHTCLESLKEPKLISNTNPNIISLLWGLVNTGSDSFSKSVDLKRFREERKRGKKGIKEDFVPSCSNTCRVFAFQNLFRKLCLLEDKQKVKSWEPYLEDIILCIHSPPSNRPLMNIVVEIMEGSFEAIEVPLMPVFQEIPAARLSQSFWDSEESSSAFEVLVCNRA
ncbi:hypothetical protein N665_0327s0009 [Sinapis alba]|nr:hypothetical protein N665_0327s0009 [Sinapis alba]